MVFFNSNQFPFRDKEHPAALIMLPSIDPPNHFCQHRSFLMGLLITGVCVLSSLARLSRCLHFSVYLGRHMQRQTLTLTYTHTVWYVLVFLNPSSYLFGRDFRVSPLLYLWAHNYNYCSPAPKTLTCLLACGFSFWQQVGETKYSARRVQPAGKSLEEGIAPG